MTMKPDDGKDPDGVPKKSAQNAERREKTGRRGRIITAKDAGWITPTAFVLPLKLLPVDPPRPIKKTSPPVD
jgi:hypothetical protein